MAETSDIRDEYLEKKTKELAERLKEFYAEECKKATEEAIQMMNAMASKEEEVMAYIGKEMEINGVYREFTEADLIAWRQSYLGRTNLVKNLAEKLAEQSTNANETAVAYINDEYPETYAFGRNASNYEYDSATGYYNLPLWNEQTVRTLLTKNPNLMPNYPAERAIERGIDLAYGKNVITRAISSAVVRGLSVNEIATELSQKLYGSDYNGAIRTARTSIGAALNGGSMDELYEERALGINVEKQWSATLDERTREHHQHLDQVHIPLEEEFFEGCQYPRDPNCPNGADIYNCRCTVRGYYPDHKNLSQRISYDEWKEQKQATDNFPSQGTSAILDAGAPSFAGGSDRPYEIQKSPEEKEKILKKAREQKRPIYASDTSDNKFASRIAKTKPAYDKNGVKLYDVALHGADTYAKFFDRYIDAYLLAEIILERKDYVKGTPIRLLSCSTGSTENTGNCFAQILANAIGAVVYAPTDILFVNPDGTFYIGNRDSGTFKDFFPRE